MDGAKAEGADRLIGERQQPGWQRAMHRIGGVALLLLSSFPASAQTEGTC